MFKTILLLFLILFNSGMALSITVIPIKGRVVNEKTSAPVYKAEIYILNTDLKVESSETGSFNFLAMKNSLSDTVTLFFTRYEYESKTVRLPLAHLSEGRPAISMVRYFHAPEVLNWPKLLVAGKVTDETGKGLEDVAIYASGTTGYTYTDDLGEFKLKVEQMRPNVKPSIWFCKKGYQTAQIGLLEFKKQKEVRLNKTRSESQSLTIKYQNADSELLESVYVVVDGTIQDNTGILGSVTVCIESGFNQEIRISHRYYHRKNNKLVRVGGSANLDPASLKPELTFLLTREPKFALASKYQTPSILVWTDFLHPQDSLLIAQFQPIPDPQIEGLPEAQSKSFIPESLIFEAGKNAKKELIVLPVIDLPDIHITVATPATLPIPPVPDRHEELAPLVSQSSEQQEDNSRSAVTLNRRIHEHNKVIQGCYKQSLKKIPDLKGILELRFILNSGGEIEDVEIISSTLAEPEMERCVLEKMKRWRFFQPIDPKYGNRSYRLKYNFGNVSR